MTKREALSAAKAKINTPQKHTIGCEARTLRGEPCDPKDLSAVAWSMLGAIVAVVDDWKIINDPRCGLYDAVGGMPVSYWEAAPGRTHAEVMAAFDRAIEACNG